MGESSIKYGHYAVPRPITTDDGVEVFTDKWEQQGDGPINPVLELPEDVTESDLLPASYVDDYEAGKHTADADDEDEDEVEG